MTYFCIYADLFIKMHLFIVAYILFRDIKHIACLRFYLSWHFVFYHYWWPLHHTSFVFFLYTWIKNIFPSYIYHYFTYNLHFLWQLLSFKDHCRQHFWMLYGRSSSSPFFMLYSIKQEAPGSLIRSPCTLAAEK